MDHLVGMVVQVSLTLLLLLRQEEVVVVQVVHQEQVVEQQQHLLEQQNMQVGMVQMVWQLMVVVVEVERALLGLVEMHQPIQQEQEHL